MNDSILLTIKKMLGITDEYSVFDQDIVININMALNTLTQIGVGPEEGFIIVDSSATWQQFLGTNKRLEMVKNYVYLKTRSLFDSDISGSMANAIDAQIKELESRISYEVDPGPDDVPTPTPDPEPEGE